MSFLTALALLVGLLAGAPVAAHLLRRRRASEIALPTASLLAATPPTATSTGWPAARAWNNVGASSGSSATTRLR